MHIVMLSIIALLLSMSAVALIMIVWYAAPRVPISNREFVQMTSRGCYVYALRNAVMVATIPATSGIAGDK